MVDFLTAVEHLRRYPDAAFEGKGDAVELLAAAQAYRDQLRTHSQLQNYINDVSVLVEALAGYFHRAIVPYYRSQPGAGAGSEEAAEDEVAVPTKAADEESVEDAAEALLECLVLLCADTNPEEGTCSTACLNRRQQVRKAVHETLIAQLSEAMIRRGVSASHDLVRAACVEKCAILTRALGNLDNEAWLKTARLAAECIECPVIRRAGVTALGVLCQNKLMLGNKTTALKLSHEIILSISALIDVFHDTEAFQNTDTLTNARYSLSALLQLLKDEDRAAEDAVDWLTFLGNLLDCRFTNDDDDDVYAGLAFLNLLHTSATDEFTAYVIAGGLCLRVLPLVTKAEHRVQRVRVEATTFLMNCADFPSLRDTLLKADCIDLVSPLVTSAAPTDDRELQAAVLALLSKLMLHGADTKELIGDTVPMWELFNDLCDYVAAKASTEKHLDIQRVCDNLVVVMSSLSFNVDFKAKILGVEMAAIEAAEEKCRKECSEFPEDGSGGTKDFPLVRGNKAVGELATQLVASGPPPKLLDQLNLFAQHCTESKGRFHIVLTLFNAIRSEHETRAIRKSKNSPDFDSDQLEQLQMLYEKLPEDAKVKERLKYVSGGLLVSSAVRMKLMGPPSIMPLLEKLVVGGRVPKTLLALASHIVRCLASLLDYRGQLVSQGGLKILLRAIEADPEDEVNKFTLASLVATTAPASFGYTSRMECAHVLMEFGKKANRELFVAFALRAVVNLTSFHEDVCLKVFDGGKVWREMENVMTDWDGAPSAHAAEILCNICARDEVKTKIGALVVENKMPWSFALLLAFAGDDSNVARQLACLGALCYITVEAQVAIWLASGDATVTFGNESLPAVKKMTELWLGVCGHEENPGSQLRLTMAMFNCFEHAVEVASKCPASEEALKNRLVEFSQQFVLALGLVWNNVDEQVRQLMRQLTASSFRQQGKELIRSLVAKAPSPDIQHLWTSLLQGSEGVQ